MTHSTMPGIAFDCAGGSGGGNNLPLPPTVTETLEGPQLMRVNRILLEYARDVALLQSRAYDAVLTAIADTPAT